MNLLKHLFFPVVIMIMAYILIVFSSQWGMELRERLRTPADAPSSEVPSKSNHKVDRSAKSDVWGGSGWDTESSTKSSPATGEHIWVVATTCRYIDNGAGMINLSVTAYMAKDTQEAIALSEAQVRSKLNDISDMLSSAIEITDPYSLIQ